MYALLGEDVDDLGVVDEGSVGGDGASGAAARLLEDCVHGAAHTHAESGGFSQLDPHIAFPTIETRKTSLKGI